MDRRTFCVTVAAGLVAPQLKGLVGEELVELRRVYYNQDVQASIHETGNVIDSEKAAKFEVPFTSFKNGDVGYLADMVGTKCKALQSFRVVAYRSPEVMICQDVTNLYMPASVFVDGIL